MAHTPQYLFQRHKPKWRPARGHGRWHCYLTFYERGKAKRYESLCGRVWPKGVPISPGCHRPPCQLRCAACDLGEIALGNADESYNESSNWRELLPG